MVGDWREVPLSELTATPATYGVVQPGQGTSDGVPMVRVNNFQEHSLNLAEVMRIAPEIEAKYERTRVRGGDVLMTIVGSVGQVAIVPDELNGWNIARAVAMIRPKEPELSRWISFVLRSPQAQHQLGVAANTTVQTTINLKDLRELKIPLPKEKERRAIAHILGTLDDKIELNRRMNQTLEAMARALFKSWFVDFDRVPAEDMQESELGLIPKGWWVGKLGDVAEHPRRSVQPEEIAASTPYIALEHMPKRHIALADWGVADGLESNKYKFKRGEILFGKLRPYFHKVGVAPVDGVCSTDIVVIAPKSPAWFGFTLAHASSDEFVEYTNAGSTGTKMPRTSWPEIARYAVALPSKPIAAEFNQQVKSMAEKIVSNIHQSQALAHLRDALLPKLISGELQVEDAERLTEATA